MLARRGWKGEWYCTSSRDAGGVKTFGRFLGTFRRVAEAFPDFFQYLIQRVYEFPRPKRRRPNAGLAALHQRQPPVALLDGICAKDAATRLAQRRSRSQSVPDRTCAQNQMKFLFVEKCNAFVRRCGKPTKAIVLRQMPEKVRRCGMFAKQEDSDG
jgi:hypothetical protein